MRPVQAAFVMEQTLGHVTHHLNLATAVHRQTAVVPTWIPIPFATSGLERMVPAFATNWSVRASLRARRRLGSALADRRHDALFFHTQVTSLFSVGLMRTVPTVISLDATPINYDVVGAAYGHASPAGGWLDERKHRLNRRAFHAARRLVTWSAWARKSLIADYGVDPEKVTVLAPGASPAYFEIGADRPLSRVDSAPIRLLFVGGDFERKGGRLLLQTIRAMNTRREFELHVVTREAIAEQPGLRVHLGVRPNSPELYRLFREADAFVLPSRGECLSIVLMEAAAAGLPIVTTDVGALREAARHEVNALVVAPGDGPALRAALEAVVDDDLLRARLGIAGHSLAREKFDAERNDQAVIDIIASVGAPAGVRSVA
jgi:glycosyltransferase involved in cell wall biosynthesis